MSLTRAQTTQLPTPVPRPQPYRVTAPMDAQQAEHIDEMFQILFDDNRNGATIPMNIEGDLLYYHLGKVTRFPISVANRVLRSNGTDPIWGQVVLTTDVTGVLPPANGGLGLSVFVIGDLIYASTTSVLSRLADVATGNALISGGVGAAPSWGKVGLTTHVSGTLGVTNGGTGLATFTAGDLIYCSASNVLTALAKSTSATRYLSNTGASNIPAWAQVALTTGVSGVLPLANGGTGLAAVPTDGQLLIGRSSDSSLQLASLIAGTNVTITPGSGTITIASSGGGGGSAHDLLDGTVDRDTTVHVPVKGDLIAANATPAWDALAVGSDAQVLTADSTASQGVKWGPAPAPARVASAATTLAAGQTLVIPQSLEIAAGVIYEVGAGALLEVLGNGNPQIAGFDLGIEVPPSSLALSTVGTIDWFVGLNSTASPAASASTHSKNGGGWIMNSFRWALANSAGLATFTSGTTMTTTAADDCLGTALNSATGIDISVNGADFGWAFRVPVLASRQVLRIIAGTFSCDGQLVISFKSGLVASKTYLTKCQVSGSSKTEQFKIPFFGMVGDEMTVQFTCKNNLGVSPNITYVCAYLAGS